MTSRTPPRPRARRLRQEARPERAVLAVADRQAKHLTMAVGGDAGGDHDRLGHDRRPVVGLDVRRVEEQVSEADDLRAILEYLGVGQSSAEATTITGLSKSAISEVLSGKRRRDTSRRRHIAIVAAVTRELGAARSAATASSDRGASAIGWLHTAAVETSRGRKTPLDLLRDTKLALEALDELRR
jgi:transcriptional regulator with XRE-family HTH domain